MVVLFCFSSRPVPSFWRANCAALVSGTALSAVEALFAADAIASKMVFDKVIQSLPCGSEPVDVERSEGDCGECVEDPDEQLRW